jgi:Domain of unknown function (DUF4907)
MMQMTKPFLRVVLMAAAFICLAAAAIIHKNNTQQAGRELLPVELHALRFANGWGYAILVNKKVFIHQDCIPAISTFRQFNNREEALLVGRKVVEKLIHGNKPAITVKELADAHIHY